MADVGMERQTLCRSRPMPARIDPRLGPDPLAEVHNQPSREPMVSEAVRRLAMSIDRLDTALENLQARLRSVLSDETPTDSPTQPPLHPQTPPCELAAAVHGLGRRVSDFADNVEVVLRRLEV